MANALRDILLQSAQAGNRIVALLDDAYFGLVYESNVAKESLFAALADLHENILAVKLDGPVQLYVKGPADWETVKSIAPVEEPQLAFVTAKERIGSSVLVIVTVVVAEQFKPSVTTTV